MSLSVVVKRGSVKVALMRALVKYEKGVGRMEIREVPIPTITGGEVLVEVDSCGICGTDLKIYDDHFPSTPPVIIGHEFSGLIREVGAGVRGWTEGERVVSEQHFSHCGACEYCLTGRRQFCAAKRSPGYYSNGAFAEFISVETSLLHRVPDQVPLDQAALVEPMAIAANAILGKAGVNTGDYVVILGTGPIALLALQMTRAAGAARIVTTGLNADEKGRFAAAKMFGADLTVNAQRQDPVEAVMNDTNGKGADLVIDLSGAAPAILGGLRMLKKDGRFCAIGLPHGEISIPWADTVLNAQTIYFSYSSDYLAWERCLGMLADGRMRTDGFTDHRYTLNHWKEAFELARSGEALKVIIDPKDSGGA